MKSKKLREECSWQILYLWAPTCEPLKCTQARKWISQLWYVRRLECYPGVESSKLRLHITTWMNLKLYDIWGVKPRGWSMGWRTKGLAHVQLIQQYAAAHGLVSSGSSIDSNPYAVWWKAISWGCCRHLRWKILLGQLQDPFQNQDSVVCPQFFHSFWCCLLNGVVQVLWEQ